MRRVFATAVGAITPNHSIDSNNAAIATRQLNGDTTIPVDLIQALPYDGKGMMSHQTKILMKAFQLAISSCDKLTEEQRLNAQVFVGNGPISLEARTIKSLIKFLTKDDSAELNFKSLSENMERLPPLDGIKMLSTAPTHFCAKETQINGPGQPIYNGTSSGLTAFCLAFEAISRGDADVAIVASADAPLVEHTLPYLKFSQQNDELIFLESAIVYILKAEENLAKGEKILFEVTNCELLTLPHEHIKDRFGQRPVFSYSLKNNGFMDKEKHARGASSGLFDILKGLQSENLSYSVCDQGQFGHFVSVNVERSKKW